MGYLKRMARDSGHAVIASIHQPRAAIWSMFDVVTLLSCGRLMYHGARDGLVEWFATLGYHYDPALHGVVSDWALDLVACGSHKPAKFYGPKTITTREQVRGASQRFVASWVAARGLRSDDADADKPSGPANKPSDKPSGKAAAATLTSTGGSGPSGSLPHTPSGFVSAPSSPFHNPLHEVQQQQQQQQRGLERSGYPSEAGEPLLTEATWLQQYVWILRREFIMITRNPADVAGRTLTFAWVAMCAGVFYYGLPEAGPGPRLRFNMLLNIIAFYCLIPYVSMSLYTADKKVYLADISAKLFRTSAYYLAKVS